VVGRPARRSAPPLISRTPSDLSGESRFP
jgi:hypothetical protein